MEHLVALSADHPGFLDKDYRARRNAIAQVALDYRTGDPVPNVVYTPDEDAVWRIVQKQLTPLHARLAAREYLEAQEEVRLATDRVPQLREVNVQLKRTTQFEMQPVAGLVTAQGFLKWLGSRVFLSTQYMRHPSVPLYTPEPDVVHELVGHAATLAHPLFAELNRAFGAATAHATPAEIAEIERIYWYSLEFGLAREKGELKAYGAGLLSSFGELGRVEKEPKLLPWNTEQVARMPYDPTRYQDTLFVAEDGLPALGRQLIDWLGRKGR